MIMLLKNSVGKKGVNNKADVKLIQEALNRVIRIPYALLAIDGISGPVTIAAIERFQRQALKFNNADGRVDVDGKTWLSLKKYLVDSPNKKTAMFSLFPMPSSNELKKQIPITRKKIAWGAKVSGAFKEKVIQICESLDLAPDYLMSCMAFETGETFSPSIKNAAGSGATGLIQFMPTTAKGLGTSTEKLAKMTAVEQLDYVKKYFTPYRNKLKKLEDVYMAILYPAAVGKPITHVLFSEGKKTYSQNKGFDANKDGKITLKEISVKVRQKYEKGLSKGYLG
jgi:peptidoglycan hydrolase-like protein with peptidoglycan-binding domain